jgi:hypothetical protein
MTSTQLAPDDLVRPATWDRGSLRWEVQRGRRAGMIADGEGVMLTPESVEGVRG